MSISSRPQDKLDAEAIENLYDEAELLLNDPEKIHSMLCDMNFEDVRDAMQKLVETIRAARKKSIMENASTAGAASAAIDMRKAFDELAFNYLGGTAKAFENAREARHNAEVAERMASDYILSGRAGAYKGPI